MAENKRDEHITRDVYITWDVERHDPVPIKYYRVGLVISGKRPSFIYPFDGRQLPPLLSKPLVSRIASIPSLMKFARMSQ